MFGYVAIDKPNILVKDFYTYKGYYCGLCKVMGKNYNQLLRLTVNYDIVLLSLLAHNYEDVEPEFDMQRCILHPVGKKFSVAISPKLLGKVGDINIILAYFKVLDDVLDDGSRKLIEKYLRSRYKKLKIRYPILCESIDKSYSRLRELEADGCLDYEMLASCFGDIMVAVGRAVTENADKLLDDLMYNLGKWIYYIDAIDDVAKDFEKKKFNPFLTKKDEANQAYFEKMDVIWRQLLYTAIGNIKDSYDKMKINISEGATSNIIYMGLNARTEFVLKKRGQKCNTTHSRYSV